jgi:hypothetical protein
MKESKLGKRLCNLDSSVLKHLSEFVDFNLRALLRSTCKRLHSTIPTVQAQRYLVDSSVSLLAKKETNKNIQRLDTPPILSRLQGQLSSLHVEFDWFGSRSCKLIIHLSAGDEEKEQKKCDYQVTDVACEKGVRFKVTLREGNSIVEQSQKGDRIRFSMFLGGKWNEVKVSNMLVSLQYK